LTNPLVSPTASRVQAASPSPLRWVRTALGAAKSKHSRENAASIAHLTPPLAARMTNYHAPSRSSSPSNMSSSSSSVSSGGGHLTSGSSMMEDRSDLGAPMLFEHLPSSVFVCIFLFVAAVQRTQIGLVSRLFARVAQARLQMATKDI
jgi:hypothetical protein